MGPALVYVGFIASGAETVGLSSLVGLDSPSLSLPGGPRQSDSAAAIYSALDTLEKERERERASIESFYLRFVESP